ncbi:MAG TPA: glycosyltransferase family 39 protein [Candidatus Eisenbacteria bacterium]|nr:glycosyltransferase family 39 protein [Candidatus Eisenbacteria bacterium]
MPGSQSFHARGAIPRLPSFIACAAIVVAALAAWLAWSPLDANDVVGGDEGYYGVMARNVLAAPRYLASPAQTPLGAPGDKPPLYPALLALSMRALGVNATALRAPSIVSAGVIALVLAGIVYLAAGGAAALAAALLLVALPWFADASRVAAAELPLTALGALAVAVIARDPRSTPRAIAAGAMLGAAFLCKLWLVAPLALACFAAAGAGGNDRAAPGAATRVRVALVAAALAVASLQLLALALTDRADLPHWLGIYFGRSLLERAGGAGYAAYWLAPPGYYWAQLTHALLLVLPLAALGVADAFRRWREPAPRALLVWAAGVILLSLFRVKAGGYLYPVVPAWIGLAALGAAALARARSIAWWPLVAGAALTSPPFAHLIAARDVPLPAWAAAWGGMFVVALAARVRPRLSLALATAFVLLAAGAGLARERARLPLRYHVPGYAAVATLARPALGSLAPARPAFVAPEAPALAFLLFRTGDYWGTPIVPWSAERGRAVQADTTLRVFVVDTTRTLYGGWPDDSTLAWLARDTREITPELQRLAPGSPLRMFVRAPAAIAPARP